MAGAPQPVKTIGEEFIAHRFLDPLCLPRGMLLPRPLNMEEYVKNMPLCQTDCCTDVAVEHLNQNMIAAGIPKITFAKGIHSNMFILSHEDPLSYFHVYFKAYVGGMKARYFAELAGLGGPQAVILCTTVSKIHGLRNCKFCFGGVRHPIDRGFIGHIAPAQEGNQMFL